MPIVSLLYGTPPDDGFMWPKHVGLLAASKRQKEINWTYLSGNCCLFSPKSYLKTHFPPHTNIVSVTNTNRVMMFRETIAAYCQNSMNSWPQYRIIELFWRKCVLWPVCFKGLILAFSERQGLSSCLCLSVFFFLRATFHNAFLTRATCAARHEPWLVNINIYKRVQIMKVLMIL
jgi:hypothetical protein